MDKQAMHDALSVDQRATIAKISLLTYESIEKIENERELEIFVNYLVSKCQHQAIHRMLTLRGEFLEVVQNEKSEESVDAIKETQHDGDVS